MPSFKHWLLSTTLPRQQSSKKMRVIFLKVSFLFVSIHIIQPTFVSVRILFSSIRSFNIRQDDLSFSFSTPFTLPASLPASQPSLLTFINFSMLSKTEQPEPENKCTDRTKEKRTNEHCWKYGISHSQSYQPSKQRYEMKGETKRLYWG